MTLEMEHRLAVGVAHLGELVVAEPHPATQESLEVVEGRALVDVGPLVPELAVEVHELAHALQPPRPSDLRHSSV
jgi:hypothetical protein